MLAGLMFVGAISGTRKLEILKQFNIDSNKIAIKQLTSDREHLWQVANRGIQKHPLLGWGMNGFGAAYPEVQYRKKLAKIIRLGDFTFDYKHKDGRILTAQLPTVKAHNLILDTTLSVGLLGLIPYLALLALCMVQIINSPYRGIEAVAIAYFAYTFTWFECAQFSHIAWWALSFFGMSSIREKVTY